MRRGKQFSKPHHATKQTLFCTGILWTAAIYTPQKETEKMMFDYYRGELGARKDTTDV